MNREVKIGLTVCTAIVLMYISITWANRSHFFGGSRIGYVIDFQHVSGLLVGDPVHIRGYTMGRVTGIAPGPNSIEVKIELDRSYPLYEGAYAEIQPKELMGGKQIELFQGQEGTERAKTQPIPGRTSLDFSSAFSRMGGLMEAVESLDLISYSGRFDSVFSHFERLILALDPEELSHSMQGLNQSMGSLETLMSSVQQRDLVAKVDTLFRRVNEFMGQAELQLEGVGGFLGKTDSLLLPRLVENLDSLSTVLTAFNTLGQTGNRLLESEETLLARVSKDAHFSQRIDSVLLHLDQVLSQIQEDKIIVGFKKRKPEK